MTMKIRMEERNGYYLGSRGNANFRVDNERMYEFLMKARKEGYSLKFKPLKEAA